MATLDELELRLRALEQAQAAEPISYYTSIFSGEEMDQRLAAAGWPPWGPGCRKTSWTMLISWEAGLDTESSP